MKRNQLVVMKIRTISQRLSAAVNHSAEISFHKSANRNSGITAITILLLGLFIGGTSFGATRTWTGNTSTDWNVGSNWLGGSVPASTDDVLIPGGIINYPVISNTITIRTININSSLSGASLTVTTGGKLTSTRLITVNANGIFSVIDGTVSTLGITCNGALNMQGGTITSNAAFTINSTGTLIQSGGIIWLAVNTATNPTANLVINSGTVTQSGGSINTKNFVPATGTFNQTGPTAVLRIFRNWKPISGHIFNSTAGTVRFSGSGTFAGNFRSVNTQFNSVLVDAGTDPGFSRNTNSLLKISGNFANNNSWLNITRNASFTFNGTGNQTITSASTGTNSTFYNLVINNPSGIVSIASGVNMSGAFTVKAGSRFDLSTYNFGAGRAPTSLVLECGAVAGSSILGSGILTLGGNVTVNNIGNGNSGASISSRVALGATRTFTVANDGNIAADLTISGILSGASGIIKAGSGTLLLSGSNTYTGVTTINSGILSVATIGNGGIAGNLGAASSTAGNLVLGGGTLQYTGATASTNRNFTLTTGTTSIIEVTTNKLTFSGAGANTTGALTKSGEGILELSGANLYTGTTSIIAGTLKYGINNALANGAVTVSGGIYDIANFSDAVGAVTLVNGSITGTTGVLTGTSYSVQSGSVSAILAGTAALSKTSTGTVLLSGLSTYTGKTTISSGVLSISTLPNIGVAGSLGAPTAAANGTIDISGTGTLRYTGTGNTSNRVINLTSGGGIIDASGSGTLTLSGGITGNTYGIVLSGTGTGIETGVIAITSGSLTKSGTGTWTLSGANSYTGTTIISDGTLTLGASGVIADASPILLSGGTFRTGAITGMNERVGTLNAGAFSTIALGTGAHTLTFAASGGVSWASDAIVTINGWSGGYNSTSGTAGRIFIGSSLGGLTAVQISQIRFFNGIDYYKATILASGELVATSIPFIITSPPTALSYPTPNVFDLGVTIAPLIPTVIGFVESYTISPALPVGLSINGLTGIISGTTTAPSSPAIYTVTAANIIGSTTFDISISVTTTLTTGGSGYWSSTIPNAPWPNGYVPTIINNVIIAAGNTVTVDIPNAVCNSITVGKGLGTASLDYTATGNPFLSVTTDVAIGGSGNTGMLGRITFSNGSALAASDVNLGGIAAIPAPGTINMTAGGTLITGELRVNNTLGTWTPGTGTVQMTGTNTLPSSIFTSFRNLQIDAGTTTTAISIPSISGLLTVKAGATFLINHPVGATTPPAGIIMECGAPTGSSINGTGILSLGGNVTVNNAGTGTNGASIFPPLTLTAAGNFFVNDDGTSETDLTISGVVSGATGLTKDSAGTMALSGLNTYNGKTMINDGTISINTLRNVSGGSSSLGSPTTTANGTVDISGTGTLQYTGSGHSSNRIINLTGSGGSIDASGSGIFTLSGGVTGNKNDLVLTGSGMGIESGVIGTGTGMLTKQDVGEWTLTGNNTYSGSTLISNGTLKLGASERIANSGSLIVDGTFDLAGYSETVGSLEGDGIVTSSAAGTSILTAGGNNLSTEFSGIIEDGTATSVNLTKVGTGILTLSDVSTYTGVTNISSGTLKVGLAEGAVPDLSAVTVTGTLDLAGNNETIGSLAGSGSVTSTEPGSIVLMTGENNTNTLFSGVIQNGSDTVGFKKSGTGTLTLSGNNTYTGVTTISEGTLKLGASERIANASALIVDGTFDMAGFNETTASLEGTGLVTSSVAGSVVLATGGNNWNTIYSGIIRNGTALSLGLAKAGSGSLTLSGINTYTGLTSVNSGTLRVNSPSALGSSANGTTIAGGSVLDLNGTNYTTAEPLTVNGTGISGSGALINSSVTGATFAGLIALGSGSSIVGGAGTINLSNTGTITGPGFLLTLGGAQGGTLAGILATGNGKLIKTDAGAWTLSGANTFTGGTTLNAGTLNINNAQALGTVAGNFIINGGSIDNTSGGSVTTLNYLQTWNGDFSFAGSNALNLGTGVVTMNASRRVTVNGNVLTVGGIITAPLYNLTKTGAGTLSFGSNPVTFNGLNISAGTLVSTSGLMNLAGNFSNNGTFTHNNGTVNFNGSALQSIPAVNFFNLTSSNTGIRTLAPSGTTGIAGTFTPGSNAYNVSGSLVNFNGSTNQIIPSFNFNDLSLSTGGIKSIQPTGQITVNGVLTNYLTADKFVINSTSSGTGSLIHNTPNVSATVQRYISGGAEAWHFLSSPVADQSISGQWLPSGTYGNGTGYDLYVWNEPTSCWVYNLTTTYAVNWNTVHPGSNFDPGRGYLYAVQALNPTHEFIGNLNSGQLDYGLTTNSPDINVKGFNFVGNPYASAIDWQASSGWTRSTHVNSAGGYDMWIWNQAANNYGVCNSNTGICTNSITRYIAPMQGFFVKASAAGNLGINNSVRVHNTAGSWFKNSGTDTKLLSMVVQSEADNSFDEAQLLFGCSANQPGAAKLFSYVQSAPALFLTSGSENCSVLYFTGLAENPTVPVMFKPGRDGNYSLKFNFDADEFENVMLEDRLTNYIQDMKAGNAYSFKASKTDNESRFVLHFSPDKSAFYNELPARIYTDDSRLVIDLTIVSGETEASVYDASGRLLMQKTLQGSTEHSLYMNASTQILIVQLKNRQGNICRKLFYNNKY